MRFKLIHIQIIRHAMKYAGVDYFNNPENLLPPSKDTLSTILEGDYSELTISDAVDELVSNGVLEYYSMHYYLRMKPSFYESQSYKEIEGIL